MRRVLALLLALAIAAAGCSKAPKDERAGTQGYAPSAPPPEARVEAMQAPVRVGGNVDAAPSGFAGGVAGGVVGGVVGGVLEQAGEPGTGQHQGPPPGAAVPVPKDRKLIRDAHASLEVTSVDEALSRLRGLAEGSGGYVTSEHRSRDERGAGRGMLVMRVPAGKLDSLTAALKSIGKVERFQVSANDITEEYFNLEIRLRNQRQLEARLLELLNRPGNRLSDLLETERELARVRGEIDQLEGRQRFWDNHVALSTVTVEVYEPGPAVAGEQGGAWAALKRSFADAADNFVLAIAGIIAATGGLIPVVVALALVLYVVVRWWRWRRRKAAL